MPNELPDHAQVVVIGAGIVGCSVAYHLTQLGWTDVVVLEKQTLASGTTGHGAGLVTQLRHTRALTDLSRYSADLYPRLEAETGQSSGFRRTGSISVARAPGRMDELKRSISMARGFGVRIEAISLHEAREMWPLMDTDGLVGAIHIPEDGQTVPDSTTMALVMGATQRGAVLQENVRVTGIIRRGGAVAGVSTDRGNISCEMVVNCAGMWAREIGLTCGVNVPLHAADHAYLVTRPIEGVADDLPTLRDPDGHIYFRRDIEDTGGLLMGGFEPVAKPWGMDGIPEDYATGMLNRDWSHYQVFVENAVERVPAMEDAQVSRFLVGPESFTPDNNYIIGEAPELRGFFVAAGFNSSGIASAAGAGRAVAEWMVEGEPTMDLWEVDIRRFQRFQNSSRYLYDRTVEGLGLLYAMHWPNRQNESARGVRRTPLHDRLAARGACFGQVAGWERANWFAPEGVQPQYEYSYGRQNWFDYSAKEHRAVREAVGLFDQTSFGKFLLQGRDSQEVLQGICAGDVDVPPGRVVYTAMLNGHGGIEADVTVTRLSEDRYLIVSGAATSARDFVWIRDHIRSDASAVLTDVTSAYVVLGVMGPNARALLSQLTDDDMSNEAFPYLTSREITMEYAVLRASRVTYVGELGWELYVPTEFAAHVYDAIVDNGSQHGLKHAGYHAMEPLRIEKGYRAWGHDIAQQDTPLEAGLGFAVAFDKAADFIGKAAILRQREQGVRKRMVVLTLDDPEPLLLGDEPIYRDGVLVGRTTSGAYGHTLGRSVGMGYVEHDPAVEPSFIRSGSYEIEVATERFLASAGLRAPYDPNGKRVRE